MHVCACVHVCVCVYACVCVCMHVCVCCFAACTVCAYAVQRRPTNKAANQQGNALNTRLPDALLATFPTTRNERRPTNKAAQSAEGRTAMQPQELEFGDHLRAPPATRAQAAHTTGHAAATDTQGSSSPAAQAHTCSTAHTAAQRTAGVSRRNAHKPRAERQTVAQTMPTAESQESLKFSPVRRLRVGGDDPPLRNRLQPRSDFSSESRAEHPCSAPCATPCSTLLSTYSALLSTSSPLLCTLLHTPPHTLPVEGV